MSVGVIGFNLQERIYKLPFFFEKLTKPGKDSWFIIRLIVVSTNTYIVDPFPPLPSLHPFLTHQITPILQSKNVQHR